MIWFFVGLCVTWATSYSLLGVLFLRFVEIVHKDDDLFDEKEKMIVVCFWPLILLTWALVSLALFVYKLIRLKKKG